MDNQKEIIIIGAGLSGLTLAYLLSKQNISVTILEGSERIGGRIQTTKGNLETPLELGATWFSDIHKHLLSLLEELGIKKYNQLAKGKSLFQTKSFEPVQEFEVPESESPSYRVEGGTSTLINTLYNKIKNQSSVYYNHQVVSIAEAEEEIVVTTSNGKVFKGIQVIICMPPQLISTAIKFSPPLPNTIDSILPTVQTWMAGSIKFVLEYERPFWRENGYSGMLFSHSGIINEMYDHTNIEENKFGFTGFLNGGVAPYPQEIRKENVLKQLELLLGKEALNPTFYQDKVWTNEFILKDSQIIQHPHQNNGHPVFQDSYYSNRLLIAGTETAQEYPGYMEGAVISAKNVFDQIMSS